MNGTFLLFMKKRSCLPFKCICFPHHSPVTAVALFCRENSLHADSLTACLPANWIIDPVNRCYSTLFTYDMCLVHDSVKNIHCFFIHCHCHRWFQFSQEILLARSSYLSICPEPHLVNMFVSCCFLLLSPTGWTCRLWQLTLLATIQVTWNHCFLFLLLLAPCKTVLGQRQLLFLLSSRVCSYSAQ